MTIGLVLGFFGAFADDELKGRRLVDRPTRSE